MLALLIDLGWKSALIAGGALLVSRAMRGRPAGERVFLLRLAVAMLLALPVAAALLPPLDLAVLPALAPEPMPSMPVRELAPAMVAAPPSTGIDLAMLLAGLYLAGAAAVLLHLAAGIFVLARWSRRGASIADPQWQAALHRAGTGLRRPVRLLESRDVATPLSWGVAPAWILVDPGSLARGGQAEAVIAHEMAHVRRLDWPMLVAARIALALFWCNPLAWLLARTLAHQSEIAADEAAVLRVERLDYAQALLAFATAPAGHRAATGMALWPSALKERIARVVEARVERRSSPMLLAALLTCAIGATPTLAAVQFVRAAPDERERLAPATLEPVARAPMASRAPKARVETTTPALAPSAGPWTAASASRSSSGTARAPATDPGEVPVPVTRIVGRTGASVVMDQSGMTIVGAQDDQTEAQRQVAQGQRDAAQGRRDGQRGAEEGARAAEQAMRNMRLERRDRARELRAAAATMRRQADDFERTANEPGQIEGVRKGHLDGAMSLRAGAEKMEAEAAKLEGS